MDFPIFNKNEKDLEVTIANRGISPAIIKQITYTVSGKKFLTWDEALEEVGALGNTKTRINYWSNTALSPDSEHVILLVTKTKSQRFRIAIEIIYKSIYEEEFTKNLSI